MDNRNTATDALEGVRPANGHERRSARSTSRLLDAAAELIAEQGYGSLTVAAIGERAGYSRGLVSVRFGSKEAMLEQLVERITTHWFERVVVPRSEGRTGLESVVILLDAIKEQVEQGHPQLRALYRLMFDSLAAPSLRERFTQMNHSALRDFETFIRRGQRDGSIRRDVRADDEAALIVSALRGIAFQWMLDPDGFDPLVVHATLQSMVMERLPSDH